MLGKKYQNTKKKFEYLVKLVEDERKQIQEALKDFSNDEISTERLAELINKRKEQFDSGSKDDFIVNLRRIDVESWTKLDGLQGLEYNFLASLFKPSFKQVDHFYGTVAALLYTLSSVCTNLPQSSEEKKESLAQIHIFKNEMLESFCNISVVFEIRKLVPGIKSNIENFFESQISDLKNAFALS